MTTLVTKPLPVHIPTRHFLFNFWSFIFLDCVHRFDLIIFITLYIVKYKFNAGYAVLIRYHCRLDVNCGHVQTCRESWSHPHWPPLISQYLTRHVNILMLPGHTCKFKQNWINCFVKNSTLRSFLLHLICACRMSKYH